MSTLRELGYVSSEGGPLLILDAIDAASWTGVEGPDYERACGLLDSNPGLEGLLLSVGDESSGVIWELNGAGYASVFEFGSDCFVLVRSWPNDPDDADINRCLLALPERGPEELGVVDIRSAFLVILWSAECGASVGSLRELRPGRPQGEMAVDSAGLIVECSPGKYLVTHDSVEAGSGIGRRCKISRVA
jgi:hypothetical protein